MTLSSIPRGASGIWLITTEHGTRLWFDLDERLWLREPAPRADGRINRWATDRTWQRLGRGPSRWTADPAWDSQPPRVGDPVEYGSGLLDAPNRSTPVVSIEQVQEDDAPPPFDIVAEREETWWVVRDRRGWWHSTGTTRREAAVVFAREADQWLDEVWKSRETSRAARWLAGRVDRDGSLLTWVLECASKRRPEWRPRSGE